LNLLCLSLKHCYFIIFEVQLFFTTLYPKHAPEATATALPPELPPAMNQSFSGVTSLEAEVFNLKLMSGLRQIFLVAPKAESMAPDLYRKMKSVV
jgi:hypothetical protein